MGSDSDLVATLLCTPLPVLKSSVVAGDAPIPAAGVKPGLNDHAEMLRLEFVGQSQLALYHALLNVLLRRGIDVAVNVGRMRQLWREEREFLLERLDSRWLVSACDTIADHFPEPEEKATALIGSVLVNVVKLYETERLAAFGSARGETVGPHRWTGPQELFDGIVAFSLGTGDMVLNLHRRLDALTRASPTTAAAILRELIRRVNAHNTVLSRFRKVHTKDVTRW